MSGGEGSITETVIGAFIISVLTNGLRTMVVSTEWQTVVTGVVLAIAVYFDMLRRQKRERALSSSFMKRKGQQRGGLNVDIQYGDGDHLKSADIAKSIMIANPDVNLIYTSNEGACVGAYSGLQEIGMIGKVLLIGDAGNMNEAHIAPLLYD